MSTQFLFKDYYKIIGTERSATTELIKRAFREKAKESHPDISKREESYSRFVLIREAYDILSDIKKKEEYDQLWDKHHNIEINNSGSADYIDDVLSAFGNQTTEFYRDEWDYFRIDPRGYLKRFGSTTTIIISSSINTLIGIAIPFAITLFSITVIMGYIGFLILLIVTISSSVITGIIALIIYLLLIKRLWIQTAPVKDKILNKITKVVLYPLSGIPIVQGKWILFSLYSMSFCFMVWLGYFLVQNTGIDLGSVIRGDTDSFYNIITTVLAAVAFVFIFSITGIFLFEIISRGINHYPKRIYVKVKIKKQQKIVYIKDEK